MNDINMTTKLPPLKNINHFYLLISFDNQSSPSYIPTMFTALQPWTSQLLTPLKSFN